MSGGASVSRPLAAATALAAPPGFQATGTAGIGRPGIGGLGAAALAGDLSPVVATLQLRRPVQPSLGIARPILVTLSIEGRGAMSGQQHKVGEAIEASALFKSPAGAALVVTGVAIRAKVPGGEIRTYGSSAGDAPGEWVATIPLDTPGRWFISAECGAPTPAVSEVAIDVLPRLVA